MSESRQMLIRELAVREVEVLHPGMKETAQLPPSHGSSLQQDSSQSVLQVGRQRLNIAGRRTS